MLRNARRAGGGQASRKGGDGRREEDGGRREQVKGLSNRHPVPDGGNGNFRLRVFQKSEKKHPRR